MPLLDRLLGDLRTAVSLVRSGVRMSSVVAYPIRRRIQRRAQLSLSGGPVFAAPAQEPLLSVLVEVWLRRCYLPAEISLLRSDTVVDIGANVGVFSLLAATLVPTGRVISVEPGRLRAWLELNVRNSGASNVTTLPYAVAGRSESATLYARGTGAMNTLYRVDNYGSAFTVAGHVQTISLDDLFTAEGVNDCGLLKLDCEGAEYEILFNASPATLARIRQVVGEYHVGLNAFGPHDLASHLTAHGFDVRLEPLIDVEGGYFFARRLDALTR